MKNIARRLITFIGESVSRLLIVILFLRKVYGYEDHDC